TVVGSSGATSSSAFQSVSVNEGSSIQFDPVSAGALAIATGSTKGTYGFVNGRILYAPKLDTFGPTSDSFSYSIGGVCGTLVTVSVQINDAPPLVDSDQGAVSSPEDAAATNTGTWFDFDDEVMLTADHGTVTKHETDYGWDWSGTGDDDSPYTVTITATNEHGTVTTTSFDVSFTDVPPTFVSQV